MSINMNNRELKIVKILRNSVEPMSSIALSEEIGCSTKTIQSDIKSINKALHKSKIVSIRGIGYKLEGSLEELDVQTNLYDDIDRVSFILKKLINISKEKENFIRIEDLADLMYVSSSTVKNDLKEVKRILSQNDLKIITKHKQGICIDGDEEQVAKQIVNLCNNKNNKLGLSDFLSNEVSNSMFDIKNRVLNVLESEELLVTDLEFKNIVDYILIFLSRSTENEDLIINEYLRYYKVKRNEIINNDVYKEKIINSIRTFCMELKIVTNIDITKDTIFEECLYSHISNLYKKIELGINDSYYISSNEIKLKYAFAFELAKIAKKVIEGNLNIIIDEDETANIAIHIGGAIERSNNYNRKKVYKAVIVCTSGIGTSMLIKSKLENLFAGKIEIIKVIPAYLTDYLKVIDTDFVISTVPIELDNTPLIKISPLLTEKEIKIIEKYIETEKIYKDIKVEELLDKDLFHKNLDFSTKEEVIEYMSNFLLEKNYIDIDMKNSYFEREKIATTEIGNMLAMPHSSKGKVFKNKISIGILKNPIYWEVGEVRLVIMLAIDKDHILDYEELFSNIYKRVDSIAKVISICENKNYEKFKNMFK
ncbi:BglG family transcription antiterminator [Romboutsia sp. 1001713B170207_170306_H8]|uniref:BglG family transcription antiterminator n=1 Tax=Romboutsia sp. 1001713B170207_170306_H8 TaxID=2787112 RepID=UPI0011C98B12|nr:PTS sugar transporter subunit IIA [Romboutsia sp. 1001713B170207_170306_H8]